MKKEGTRRTVPTRPRGKIFLFDDTVMTGSVTGFEYQTSLKGGVAGLKENYPSFLRLNREIEEQQRRIDKLECLGLPVPAE